MIALHANQDVDVQERALALVRAAVAAGQASRTELAYLEDRVALNRGRPQRYGTQIGCVDGRAEPAELEDPEGVDERRAAVGLSPLDDTELAVSAAGAPTSAPPPTSTSQGRPSPSRAPGRVRAGGEGRVAAGPVTVGRPLEPERGRPPGAGTPGWPQPGGQGSRSAADRAAAWAMAA
ncbi:MAG TPA: DUF6624 domain-containing protein [Acidimicrobiales bacterium]